MRRFNSLNLSVKLPIVIVMFTLMVAIVTGTLGFLAQRNLAITSAETRLSEITSARLDEIELWLDGVENSLLAQAANSDASRVVRQFDRTFSEFSNPLEALQRHYITENANPTGSKHLLDAADDGSAYSYVHGQYHDIYRSILEREGYYDIFLINPEGDIVYTVFKELDFATNLTTGEYATSGLAEAFTQARDLSAGDIAFIDYRPYAPSFGAPAAFLATPIFDETGTFAGVLAYQLPSDRLLALISHADGLGETGEIFLIGGDNLSRAGSRLGTVDDVLVPLPPSLGVQETGLDFVPGLAGPDALSVNDTVQVFDTTWRAVVQVSADEILAPAAALAKRMVWQILLCSAIVAMMGGWISRTITIPVQKVRDSIVKIAEDDYDIRLPSRHRNDEIGTIAKVLRGLCEKLSLADRLEREARVDQEAQAQVVAAISTGLNALSQGNLNCQITQSFPEKYERLRSDFNETVDTLSQTIRAVIANAEELLTSTESINAAAEELSQRTVSQAATLEETAAAIQDITNSVNAAAEGAKEVESTVAETHNHAETSDKIVQSAVETMAEIESGSNQMSQIISVIDDIAFQTNLLALNAGVEAARAGESGRGFAVVAQEVRALAQRSADAAQEISQLISNSRSQVKQGVTLVGNTGEALVSIIGRVKHIAELVANIAQGTVEQASGLRDLNASVSNLDTVTQKNAGMVVESAEAAQQLKLKSDHLVAAVQHFQTASDARAASAPGSDSDTAQTEVPSAA